jgi:hypothetical protein
VKLPNGDRADLGTKLSDYVLNPEHQHGRHKARVFASSLGITRQNQQLKRMDYPTRRGLSSTRNLFYCVAMTNDIHMHDLVALTEDVAATHFITHQPLRLRRGQVGTVVMPLNGNDFQVEFSDREGRAYAMLPLNNKQLMILREQPEATAV